MKKLFVLKNLGRSLWPFYVILGLCLIFFYPVFLKGFIPMPADLIVGAYYPWFDYKWVGYGAGVPVKNPLISDIPSVIYPQRLYAMTLLQQGIMPLWNNLMFCGYPLLATFQSAVLYPLNFIYFLTSFVKGWTIEVILQPVLAASFTYIFLRNLKLSKLSSLFGSVAYAFSAFNIFFLEWNVHGHVAAYIPLILFLIDKYLARKEIVFLVLMSFVIGIQIFAGYPQLTMFSLIVGGFWAAFRVFISNGGKGKGNLFFVGLFMILGITFSSIQLLPGLELYQYSQRVTEKLGPDLRLLPPQELISIFAPNYYGNPATYNFWGTGNFANMVGYSGLLTFIMSLISLRYFYKRKEIKFFAFLSLACLIITVDTFFSRFITDTFSSILGASAMTRFLVFFNLSLAVLSAFGIESLNEKISLKKLRLAFYPSFIIISSLFLGTFLVLQILKYYQHSLSDFPVAVSTLNFYIKNYLTAMRNLLIPALIVVFTGVLIFVNYKNRKLKNISQGLLFLLLIFELFGFGWKITPFVDNRFVFPTTPAVDFLKSQHDLFRVTMVDTIPANMWMPYLLEAPDGYDAVYPFIEAKMIGVINSQNVEASPMNRYGRIDHYDSRLLGLLNTKYLMAIKRDKEGKTDSNGKVSYLLEQTDLKPVSTDKSVMILENQQALPRAFMVTQWQTARDDKSLFATLLDKSFPLGKAVLLSENFNQYSQSETNTSTVSYLSYSSVKSTIEVNSDHSGLLFVSNTWYPGWQALVDKKPAPILHANYAFQAIPVTKGIHTVELFYQPASFQLGKIISFISLVILGVLLIGSKALKFYRYHYA